MAKKIGIFFSKSALFEKFHDLLVRRIDEKQIVNNNLLIEIFPLP